MSLTIYTCVPIVETGSFLGVVLPCLRESHANQQQPDHPRLRLVLLAVRDRLDKRHGQALVAVDVQVDRIQGVAAGDGRRAGHNGMGHGRVG